MLNKKISVLMVAACLLCAPLSFADETPAPAQTAHSVVELMTEKLVAMIIEHQDEFDENPEPFYQALDGLLDQAIDFKWIAYNVMGPYRKQATPDQRQRFAGKFRRDLVETYGGGLVAFGDQKIVVLPPKGDIEGKRTVRVDQEIYGADETYPLQYTMGLKRSGEWKITNVIINGVNLGKTFRNQFLQRAQKFDGDLDRVIDDWSSSVED